MTIGKLLEVISSIKLIDIFFVIVIYLFMLFSPFLWQGFLFLIDYIEEKFPILNKSWTLPFDKTGRKGRR